MFLAKFNVDGQQANVLGCKYKLKQEVDVTGRPAAVTRGGTITLTVESTGKTSWFEWMTNSFERRDGSIAYIKRDESGAIQKELFFKEAYMVEYNEEFDNADSLPLRETFTLSARVIQMGEGEHVNEWV